MDFDPGRHHQHSKRQTPALGEGAIVSGSIGKVFDIKRFAVHDGPGIRTTAFLKGCTLRCSWCHSPESQRTVPELSYHAVLCLDCGECRAACPAGLLTQGPGHLERSRCRACGVCAQACHGGALRLIGQEITTHELVELLARDAILHESSGGGITLSGGEPGLQPHFAASVLCGLRHRGCHTAVQTAGNVPWAALAALAEWTNLFLYDLKHAASPAHQAACGAGNELILDNLRRLSALRGAAAPELVVRVPLVPGFNDSPGDLGDLAEILAALPRLDGVELLPYHDLGVAKYATLGRVASCPHRPAPSRSDVTAATAILAAHGLAVQSEVPR